MQWRVMPGLFPTWQSNCDRYQVIRRRLGGGAIVSLYYCEKPDFPPKWVLLGDHPREEVNKIVRQHRDQRRAELPLD